MTLAPWHSPLDRLERALAELRRGAPIALASEGALWLAVSAETTTARAFGLVAAQGAPMAALGARRAATLKIRAYDGEAARVALPQGAGPELAAALADPAQDMAQPFKGPFAAARGEGGAAARLLIRLCARAGLLPAAVMARADDAPPDIARLNGAEAEGVMASQGLTLARFAAARVPLALSSATTLYGYRPSDGGPDHFAALIGSPAMDAPVLARIHSSCLTGDCLGSLKCDCGPQLRMALARLAAEGGGLLLYLAQEGRGLGMANKLRAYALQDQGFDTVEANHRLGFEDDLRDFRAAALMVKDLGFPAVRLMTNNPAKTAALERHGLPVAGRVPLKVGRTAANAGYLATKAARSGHLL